MAERSGGAVNPARGCREPVVLRGLASILQFHSFFHDPIRAMREMHQRYGPLAGIGGILPFGPSPKNYYMAVGGEINRVVMSDLETFRTTGQTIRGPVNSAQRRIRYGLTRMNGPLHRQQRQLVQPHFQKKAVEGYLDSMVQIADSVLGKMHAGTRLDLFTQLRLISLRISSTILFSQDGAEAVMVGGMIDRWLRMNFSGPVWAFQLNLPGTPYRRMLKLAERIETGIMGRIAERRAEPGKHHDILSNLIAARDDDQHGMTDEQLVGQTAILFGASYETTAAAMNWTLFLLMQHPVWMAKVVEELQTVLGDGPLTLEKIARLTVLDDVIRESMRILPAAPFTIRAVKGDVQLGGYLVRSGSLVIMCHYLTHHLPEVFPEPERFLPERWQTINPGPYDYVPFSGGPRLCIGMMFAVQTMKVTLALLLRKFRPRIVDGSHIDRLVRITMRPKYGMPVDLFKQDGKFSRSDVRGNVHDMVRMD